MDTTKGLSLDLRVYKGNNRNTLNIFDNSTGFIQELAYLDQDSLVLRNNTSRTFVELFGTRVVVIQSYVPIRITTTVNGNLNPTVFNNQTLLVISDHVGEITIANLSGQEAKVQIIRLAQQQIVEPTTLIPRQLITFAPLSRITQLPENVFNINNLIVQSVTLANWTNDQVTNFGTGSTVNSKYRICNSDGTANATGNYIMILNDVVSQQNFSGTLQLWVEETSSI